MTDKKITLKDVARVAGVATGTVSMVLNDSPLVAQSTKAKVKAVMQDLGYIYDRTAGNLRSKRSRIVGAAMCNLVNPYFADVTAGIQMALEDLGRVLVLGNCAESVERQHQFLQTLRQYRVEGLLLTPAIGTPKTHVEELLSWKVPLVQVSRYVPGVASDYVGNDNRLAATLATRHLLELGHRRIGFLGRNQRTSTGQERFEGFELALAEAGLRPRDHWLVECEATREDGFRETVQLVEGPDAPTAILCFNDIVAFGAMLGLRSVGMEPGVDCSIMGMDDVSEAALWRPALTTISIPRDSIGRVAGELLMARLNDPARPFERVVIDPTLVVRASTGRPPASPG